MNSYLVSFSINKIH